jgi:hypothetical protein
MKRSYLYKNPVQKFSAKNSVQKVGTKSQVQKNPVQKDDWYLRSEYRRLFSD